MNGDIEKFNEQRKKGQNEGILEKIIREDLIEEFILYVNKENYPLTSLVKKSIFEVNEFLLKKDDTTLIEYAAFYGSSQIFNYLYKSEIELTSKLFLYSIHGSNKEIINLLEDNIRLNKNEKVNLNKLCLKESIKCNQNHLTEFIESNFLKDKKYIKDICLFGFQYYNFISIDTEFEISEFDLFNYACKYDYYTIVEYLL